MAEIFRFIIGRTRVLTPLTDIFEFFLDDECENEPHGIREYIAVISKKLL
jgi:hypothetical protein